MALEPDGAYVRVLLGNHPLRGDEYYIHLPKDNATRRDLQEYMSGASQLKGWKPEEIHLCAENWRVGMRALLDADDETND